MLNLELAKHIRDHSHNIMLGGSGKGDGWTSEIVQNRAICNSKISLLRSSKIVLSATKEYAYRLQKIDVICN